MQKNVISRYQMMSRIFLFLFLMGVAETSKSQEQLFTFGLQYKPLFESRFFDAGSVEAEEDVLFSSVRPVWGHSGGMIIRRGFTKLFAYETGISYVKRNYRMDFRDKVSSETDHTQFGMVSYEIPNQFLIYIQLGDRLFMNTAFGTSVVAFASDVQSSGINNDRFYHYTQKSSWFASFALTANIGFEYRTEKSGFFYFGGSFQRPFNDIATSFVYYDKSNHEQYRVKMGLSGAYLTADIRYFFHAEPVKKEKNRTK